MIEKTLEWFADFLPQWPTIAKSIAGFIPQLLGAIATIFIGWIVARITRALIIRALRSLDRLSALAGLSNKSSIERVDTSVLNIIGNVAFWLVMLVFLAVAANMLGLTLFAGWLDRVINHLPNLMSGGLIIFAGYIFGSLIGDTIRTAAQSLPVRQRTLVARGAQIFTVTTIILIGIDQIGIDIGLLITIIAVSVGALLGGLAFAFGLGSQVQVSNLIAAHYLNKEYRVGEQIKIGEITGTILEVSSVAVVVETDDGRVTIPAKLFSEQASILVRREARNAREI